MLSKYGILCEVIAEGSFTKVAEHFGYSRVTAAISRSWSIRARRRP